jgi:hypothetical protein
MIASSAFFVLDGILGWPVELYDGSWSQWGQMSADAANGGQLHVNSPWRTDIPSRSSVVAYNYSSINAPVFTGSGLNDLATGVTTTITIDRYYQVRIDGMGSPDTFTWSKDGGVTWDAAGVGITSGVAQPLTEGAVVTFTTGTGHATNALWSFTAGARKAVELLSTDGGTCTATLNLDGTKTMSPSGCSVTAPGSFDTSGNKIEEEDAAFMGSGGSGGGGGGGPATGC